MKAKTTLRNVIVRTRSAGVFAGELKTKNAPVVTLHNARRLWYWTGAASLSQLAVDGTSSPSTCKFPTSVQEVYLPEVIEILPLSDKAKATIAAVPTWQA